MLICSPAFFGKRNQHNPSVFFAACTIYITFFYKIVNRNRQRSDRNRKFFGYERHISRFINADCLDDMHIVIGDLAEFPRPDRFFFQCHNIMEQSNQNII